MASTPVVFRLVTAWMRARVLTLPSGLVATLPSGLVTTSGGIVSVGGSFGGAPARSARGREGTVIGNGSWPPRKSGRASVPVSGSRTTMPQGSAVAGPQEDG